MNIGKVSKVECPRRKTLDSSSNSKGDIITPKESKVKNSSNNHHLNEVKPKSIKSKKEVKTSGVNPSNTTRKWNESCGGFLCSSSGSKSNADTGKKIVQERNHDEAVKSKKLQSNSPTQSSKAQPIPVMKSLTKKTSSSKDPSRDNNQKSEVLKNQITKHPPPYNNTMQKVVSKDPQVATRNKEAKPIPKPNAPEASRRTHVSKVSSQVVKKNRPSPTRYEPDSYIPTHYIRWEGLDNEVCGHKCNFCNKDLSCSPDNDDDGYGYGYGYGYDEYDGYSDDENKYQVLLPAVDILACGHAFHSECGNYVIPDEQSTDPQCVLCLSMA